jgi:hypothetical protein
MTNRGRCASAASATPQLLASNSLYFKGFKRCSFPNFGIAVLAWNQFSSVAFAYMVRNWERTRNV